MRRWTLLLAALLLAACTTSIPTKDITRDLPTPSNPVDLVDPTLTPTDLPTETPLPEKPRRTNWLLLGGDYRHHRRWTEYGNNTDVMILVSVLETDPMQITMIQYPRNLYIPINGMDDMWLFSVYGAEDMAGLHYYWQEAFDQPLHGIFYIHMDGFVKLVDDLGELQGHPGKDGEAILAYLRDNDNNWNRGTYDAERRALGIAYALAAKVEEMIVNEPVVLAGILFDRWHGLVMTDVADLGQLAFLVSLGWQAKSGGYEVDFVQLEEPVIVRGDTPLPVRGMIAREDLKAWHASILP
jgi:hypothetical protein